MLDFLGFPGLALYLILGKTAVLRIIHEISRASAIDKKLPGNYKASLKPF